LSFGPTQFPNAVAPSSTIIGPSPFTLAQMEAVYVLTKSKLLEEIEFTLQLPVQTKEESIQPR
jgi:hypothetical protein